MNVAPVKLSDAVSCRMRIHGQLYAFYTAQAQAEGLTVGRLLSRDIAAFAQGDLHKGLPQPALLPVYALDRASGKPAHFKAKMVRFRVPQAAYGHILALVAEALAGEGSPKPAAYDAVMAAPEPQRPAMPGYAACRNYGAKLERRQRDAMLGILLACAMKRGLRE